MERNGELENTEVISLKRKGAGDTEESMEWKRRANQNLIFKKSYAITTLESN